jgi:alpha/beta superfamily hydrolase
MPTLATNTPVVRLSKLVAGAEHMTSFWDPEPAPDDDLELALESVAASPAEDGSYRVLLHTSRGDIAGQLRACEGGTGAVILVGGARGGLDGPAGGIYPQLSDDLACRGASSLRLHFRQPGEFEESVLDVLAGVSFLKGIGAERIALVGHSFGAAVMIKAGQLAETVVAVAALSSQLFGTAQVSDLAPRSLLLVHGLDDQVLEASASEIIFERASEPKRLVLYPGAGHALNECRQELLDLLIAWLLKQAGSPEN